MHSIFTIFYIKSNHSVKFQVDEMLRLSDIDGDGRVDYGGE